MYAIPMHKAIIIDKKKTKEFMKNLSSTAPNKEYWDNCNKSVRSLDMERLNRIYGK